MLDDPAPEECESTVEQKYQSLLRLDIRGDDPAENVFPYA